MEIMFSRNTCPLEQVTHENAVYGAEILRKHGVSTIALVVEARDMLRASASFRKQGIAMVPVPCAYRQFRIIA